MSFDFKSVHSSSDSDYLPSEDDVSGKVSIKEPDFGNNSSSSIPQAEKTKEKSLLTLKNDKVKTDKLWEKFLNDTEKSTKSCLETSNSHSCQKDFQIKGQHELDDLTIEESGVGISDISKIGDINESSFNNSSLLEKHSVNCISHKRSKDLTCLLRQMKNKKAKMTTLQKSINDWESFKKDEDIVEESTTYNRGKGGYLERQAFLMRSDIRSFKKEKILRLTKK